MFRIIIDLIGFLGALALPPYVPLICIAILGLRYSAWEAIFIGLLVDLVWLPHEGMLGNVPIFTIIAIFIVWGLQPLRNEFLTP